MNRRGGEVLQGSVLQDAQGSVPYQYHCIVKCAVLLVTIFTSFVKVETDTGKHRDRPINNANNICHMSLGRVIL